MRTLLLMVAATWFTACAATPAPNPAGPQPTNPQGYPVVITDDEDRRKEILALWVRWIRDQGIVNAPSPDLQPITGTIRSLPPSVGGSIYLPSVGSDVPMNEEETREALRRFIATAGQLLCGDRQYLSLVQHDERGNGTKEAVYEQTPFRYPLRGGYGRMTITFAADRRVIQMSSTCIPDVENLQRGFVGLGVQAIPFARAAETISGKTVSFTDSNDVVQSVVIPPGEPPVVRELVILPIPRAGEPATLEFHLAWEIDVHTSPALRVYLDAIMGEPIKAILQP